MQEKWQEFWRVPANRALFLFLAVLVLYAGWDQWAAGAAQPLPPDVRSAVTMLPETGGRQELQGAAQPGRLQDPFRLTLAAEKDKKEKQENPTTASKTKESTIRTAQEASLQSRPDAETKPVLTGIVAGEGKSIALLRWNGNSLALPPGGKIGCYEVAAIEGSRVILAGPDDEISLSLEK